MCTRMYHMYYTNTTSLLGKQKPEKQTKQKPSKIKEAITGVILGVVSDFKPVFLFYKDPSNTKRNRPTEEDQTKLRACSLRGSEKMRNTNGL